MPVKKTSTNRSVSTRKKTPLKNKVGATKAEKKKEEKTPVSKAPVSKTPVVKKNKKTEQDDFVLSKDIIENPNDSPIFDVTLYRELFMALRQKLDNLHERRERSEKTYKEYDDAVYNIIANSLTDAGAQDFLSYCYKRGKYDFCLMNYEKYMKWSFLAAATGNAFTLSKLQIFLINAVEDVLTIENHSYMLNFLELEIDNYYILISKMLCEELVKIFEITPEGLIKLPEVYQEQSEELLRLFDSAKIEAAKAVKETLKLAINQLVEYVDERTKLENEKLNKRKKVENVPVSKLEEETKEDGSEEDKEDSDTSNKDFKRPRIRKFRY